MGLSRESGKSKGRPAEMNTLCRSSRRSMRCGLLRSFHQVQDGLQLLCRKSVRRTALRVGFHSLSQHCDCLSVRKRTRLDLPPKRKLGQHKRSDGTARHLLLFLLGHPFLPVAFANQESASPSLRRSRSVRRTIRETLAVRPLARHQFVAARRTGPCIAEQLGLELSFAVMSREWRQLLASARPAREPTRPP